MKNYVDAAPYGSLTPMAPMAPMVPIEEDSMQLRVSQGTAMHRQSCTQSRLVC